MGKTQPTLSVHDDHARAWLMPRLTIEHLWLIVPAALVLWRGFLQPVRLLDFWWHLKAGEVIVRSHSIPRTDLFSFTAADTASVPHCWLTQSLYYLGYSLGGLPLLIVFNTALLLAALVPIYHLCLEACPSLRLGVVSALVAAASLALFSGMRPHVLSFVLLAIFYWVLTGYRLRRRNWLWMLPPLMALWANLHGAFIIGLGLVTVVVSCEALRRLVGGPKPDLLATHELTKLVAIFMLTVLATLVNPEGYKIFAFVHDFGINKYEFVVEWQVPRINSTEGILLFHGPFFLSLLVLLCAQEWPDLTELGIFFGFAAFGLTSYRNGVWFSLIAAPIVARYLPTIRAREFLSPLGRFQFVQALGRMTGHLSDPDATTRYGLNAVIAAIMLAITVIVSPWVYPLLDLRPMHAGLLEKETPVGAMNYIEQHQVEGRIFHPQVYGDYLIWRLWPRQRSFFNSQVHLFGPTLFEDYALAFLDPHWQERLARYDIALLLFRKNADDNQRMIADARNSANWRLLYEDELSVLFERVP